MDKTKAIVAGASAAALLIGGAFAGISIVQALMHLSQIQQVLLALGGLGFGAVGIVATFHNRD
jgi:hypothetical protein